MGGFRNRHAERTGRCAGVHPVHWRERFANDISVAWGTICRKLRIEAACRCAFKFDTPIVEMLCARILRPEPPLQTRSNIPGCPPRQFTSGSLQKLTPFKCFSDSRHLSISDLNINNLLRSLNKKWLGIPKKTAVCPVAHGTKSELLVPFRP